jgi:hypothetical protein
MAKMSGVDARTGKGHGTEAIIERDLITPYLPTAFKCSKGTVVSSVDPTAQSQPIDRIVYDLDCSAPLVYGVDRSIFPIEAVAGLVEMTMSLDVARLRENIQRMITVKAMTKRRYLLPVAGSKTQVTPIEQDGLSPRSFIIGLPADTAWSAETIAHDLQATQADLALPTHLYGLYVIGVGYFATTSVELPHGKKYRIKYWAGPDRLFRFADSLRHAFQRWPRLPAGSSVDLEHYLPHDRGVVVD